MACRLKNLVQNDLVQIQHCSCGLVHLHFGPVSLRVPESDLPQVARALRQAEGMMGQVATDLPKSEGFHQKISFRIE